MGSESMQTALNGVITLYGKLLKVRLPKKHLKKLGFLHWADLGPLAENLFMLSA